MTKNYGLILEEQTEDDFVFGAFNALDTKFAGRTVLQENGDWHEYLPMNEKQAPLFETQACVSFGTLNAIEILKKRLFLNDDNLSDRFVAKASGTNPTSGNSPKKVADTIKKQWSVFEKEHPMDGVTSVEEFYKEIPERLKTLALGRGAEYEFGYEIVQPKDAREALKYSPLCMSVHAWVKGDDGVYYKPEGAQETHWVAVWAIQPNGDYLIQDTYEPFTKQYRGTPSMLMGYYLKKQVKSDSWFQIFLRQLEALLNSIVVGEKPVYPDDAPTVPVPKPEPVTMIAGVNTRGHAHAWRGGTMEERKAMYRLAVEIGKAEGLHTFKSKILPDTHTLLDDYLATTEGESGFNAWCVNTQSLDFGVAQFSIKYYCKEYNMTPQECVDNPRRCLEIMAHNFKSKRRENWIAFKYAKDRLLNNTVKIYA